MDRNFFYFRIIITLNVVYKIEKRSRNTVPLFVFWYIENKNLSLRQNVIFMKKLPIGIQSFKDLRTNEYLYVDKTQDMDEEKVSLLAVVFAEKEIGCRMVVKKQ